MQFGRIYIGRLDRFSYLAGINFGKESTTNGLYYLANKRFKIIWWELILADPKKKIGEKNYW